MSSRAAPLVSPTSSSFPASSHPEKDGGGGREHGSDRAMGQLDYHAKEEVMAHKQQDGSNTERSSPVIFRSSNNSCFGR
jgi:hypothetical protein